MSFILPLILFINVYTIFPCNTSAARESPFPSETNRLFQAHPTVRHQQLVDIGKNMNEIIQLAKNATTQLESPPRIYATSGNSANLWPDRTGIVKTTSYGTRGVRQPQGVGASSPTSAMTLSTLLEPIDSDNYYVIFQSNWTEAGISRSHSWKFHVKSQHQAIFVSENGDKLPLLRM